MREQFPCPNCGAEMEPVMFIEEEEKIVYGTRIKTGRKRSACDYLICPYCLHKEAVDGDFLAGEWYR